MESRTASTIEQLAAASRRLATLDDFGILLRIKPWQEQLADSLLQLHQHLRQLDIYAVCAQYAFDDFNVKNDIIAYSSILTEYQQNISDKIDFLIDIGSIREGADQYMALFLEEQLDGVALQCQFIDTVFSEAGLL